MVRLDSLAARWELLAGKSVGKRAELIPRAVRLDPFRFGAKNNQLIHVFTKH